MKGKNPSIPLIIIGIIAIGFGIIRMMPKITNRINLNSFIDSAAAVNATFDSRSQVSPSVYNVHVSFEFNGTQYDDHLVNKVQACNDLLKLNPGDTVTVLVNKSDVSDCRMYLSKDLNKAEKNVIFLNSAIAAGGLIMLIIGILLNVSFKKQRAAALELEKFASNSPSPAPYSNGDMNDPNSTMPYSPQPTQPVPPPPQSFSPAPPPPPAYTPAPPPPPAYTPAPPPSYGNNTPDYSSTPYPVNNVDTQAEKPFAKHTQQTPAAPVAPATPVAPAAPAAPVVPAVPTAPAAPAAPAAPVAPAAAPVAPAPQQETVKLTKPQTPAQPQQAPAPAPQQAPAPAAPSEPVDLSSIIKKGTDDAFSIKADDYEVDPALAALIKKGGDDPFNAKADDYQVDPSLAALIKTGSDDPFRGRPAPVEPKDD